MIRFIVLFKLVDHSSENVALIREHIMNLEGKIDVLKQMEVGSNLLYGERSFDLSATFDFDSIEALHRFEHDPLHVKIVGLIKPSVADIKTVIYENKDRS